MDTSFEKQNLLLNYLISDATLFTKVSPILSTVYFDPRLKKIVNYIKAYYTEHKTAPPPEVLKVETGLEPKILDRGQLLYAETELESFCKNRAMEEAIYACPDLINEGKFGEVQKLVRDALTISIQRDLGTDYFSDPELRLNNLANAVNLICTKWFKLDEFLGGGLNRKEMIIFAAPPGVGKSLTMGNLARNLASQGLNGIYYTLELAEEIVSKRFDSMFSGYSQVELLKNITEASVKIKKAQAEHGEIFIKRMPESSTNANHLRAHIKEYELVKGRVPDFIVVDYLDLMAAIQTVSAENTFARDKFISEELRALANEFNCIMITASQLGRGSLQLEHQDDVSQANIAGGISKINTADNVVSIMQDPQQKARGEMKFKLLKTRSSNGVGNSFMLSFNSSTLILDNFDDGSSNVESGTSRLAKSLSVYTKRPEPSGKPSLPPSLPFQV